MVLPAYKGDVDITGFLRTFEFLTEDCTDAQRRKYLVSRLQGAALNFLLASKDDWVDMSYLQLK